MKDVIPKLGQEHGLKALKWSSQLHKKPVLAQSGSDLSVWGTGGPDSSCAPTGAHRQCCSFWLLFTNTECWHQPFKPVLHPLLHQRCIITWHQTSGREKLTGISARLHETQKPAAEIQMIFLHPPVFLVTWLKIYRAAESESEPHLLPQACPTTSSFLRTNPLLSPTDKDNWMWPWPEYFPTGCNTVNSGNGLIRCTLRDRKVPPHFTQSGMIISFFLMGPFISSSRLFWCIFLT